MSKTKATKTNYRPEKSVMDCVKEFLSAGFDTFTIADVCNLYTGIPKNQIATALWRLRAKGVLSKDDNTGKYTVLTGVNAPAPAEVKPKTAPKAKAKAPTKRPPHTTAELNKKLKEANEEIVYWSKQYHELAHKKAVTHEQWLNLRQQHEDALAIIRYLENKLYVALQQVAKNGSNS